VDDVLHLVRHLNQIALVAALALIVAGGVLWWRRRWRMRGVVSDERS
jgi:membrane protein DedA with SNARE-associated domain